MLPAIALAAETTAPPAGDAPTGGFGGGGFDIIFLMVPLILVFYLLVLRPQQKKVKEHKALVSNLRRGDRVVTQGGLIGQVTKVVSDTELQLEISEGVRVRAVRSAITDVLTKSTPSEPAAAEPAEASERKGKGK
jgi:preprotein translocase subunit YajC